MNYLDIYIEEISKVLEFHFPIRYDDVEQLKSFQFKNGAFLDEITITEIINCGEVEEDNLLWFFNELYKSIKDEYSEEE
jgi:hypothetical protein